MSQEIVQCPLLQIGQVLPLAEGGKNASGQNCQAPSPIHWKSLTPNVVTIVGTGATVGLKAIAGGDYSVTMDGGLFNTKLLQGTVADANGCVETVIIVGTPH